MTNDANSIASLQVTLSKLSTTPDFSSEIDDPASLDSLDIPNLMKQLDSANTALDQLESRTDSLLEKIDALLGETEHTEQTQVGAQGDNNTFVSPNEGTGVGPDSDGSGQLETKLPTIEKEGTTERLDKVDVEQR